MDFHIASYCTPLGPISHKRGNLLEGPGFALKCVEIELTTKCNLYCNSCNRVCKLAKSDEQMSVEQIERFVQESVDSKHEWERIVLAGGEPTLHPDLTEIVKVLRSYKGHNPECVYQLFSNKYTEESRDTVSRLPVWIRTEHKETRAQKTSNVQRKFYPMTYAPIDMGIGVWPGCESSGVCGLGLSRNGFYPCGMAAAIDRVYGFDMGIRSVTEINPHRLLEMIIHFCSLCGYKCRDHPYPKGEDYISETWDTALAVYNEKKPELTLYGEDR